MISASQIRTALRSTHLCCSVYEDIVELVRRAKEGSHDLACLDVGELRIIHLNVFQFGKFEAFCSAHSIENGRDDFLIVRHNIRNILELALRVVGDDFFSGL